MHDLHYATPAPDWEAFLLRMHLLAEMHIGSALRRLEHDEDAKAAQALAAAEGA